MGRVYASQTCPMGRVYASQTCPMGRVYASQTCPMGHVCPDRIVPWDKLVYMAHRFPPCASRRLPYHIRKSPSTSTVCSYPLCESFKLTVYCSCRVPEKNTSQYYVRVVFILRCHLDPTRRPMSNDTAGKVNFQPR